MPDEPHLVCCGCGEVWGNWLACPRCGIKYVVPSQHFRPVQLRLFNPRDLR